MNRQIQIDNEGNAFLTYPGGINPHLQEVFTLLIGEGGISQIRVISSTPDTVIKLIGEGVFTQEGIESQLTDLKERLKVAVGGFEI